MRGAFLAALGATLLAVLVAGCPSATPVPVEPTSTPSASASAPDKDADLAPFPYTIAELREGNKAGRRITFLNETPGKRPSKTRFTFLAVDDEHATIQTDALTDEDKPMGEPEVKISSWNDLRHHASYPKASTVIVDATAETPAGSFPCKRYTVKESTPQGEKKTIACFAKDLPGPPVELTVEVGGQLTMSMTLLKNEPGE